jgi:azurin
MYNIHRILLCSLLVALPGCGKGKVRETSSGLVATAAAAALTDKSQPAPPKAEPEPVAPAVPAPAQKVELEIGAVASTMTFDKTSLTVPAGAEVHLVLKDSKPGTLMHNWVLVKPGAEAAVAAAGLPAGPTGNYVTPGADVFAFAPLAQPGKTSEVTFQAPPAGSYPYICTFPGHYLMMKGTLVVTP